MAAFYLGVDGGQSSTTTLISNEEGHVLGCGSAGPCNHVSGSEGRAKFRNAIGGSIEAACSQAELNAATISFAAACFGLSGGAADKNVYARELVRSLQYKVTHDAEIALTGALSGQPGIIVIAGTGSMAFGRNTAGKTARAGGWGYIFGDEGGGYDLTRRALRAALRYEEGWGPSTVLYARLLEQTGAATANDLLHRFYTAEFSRPAVAALSQLVAQAAEERDPVACTIVTGAASDLSDYAASIYRHLFQPGEHAPVARVGGAFQSCLLSDEFTRIVRQTIACDVVRPRYNPAAGALIEALRLDGNSSDLSNLPEFHK